MNIGIDIDGVLTDEHAWHIKFGSEYFKKEPINVSGFSTRDIFGVTKEEEQKFWENSVWNYAKEEKPREDVSEIITKLHKEGYSIVIITAREYAYSDNEIGNNMKYIVKQWLKKNNIEYDKIFFTNLSKLKVCKENNIDIMIEDNVKNINEISNEIPVICMDNSYNKCCISDNIFRCYNWKQIYETISKIKKIN